MLRQSKDFSRREMATVAIFYADPKNDCTYREIMRLCNVSKGTAYTMLYKSVKEHMVDDRIVDLMEAKAKFNGQKSHEGKGEVRTDVLYNVLREKRRQYLENFPQQQAIQIISMYAESEETQERFCRNAGISKELFNSIMLHYIVTDFIPEDIFKKLMNKGIKNNFSEKAKQVWRTISIKRKENLGR